MGRINILVFLLLLFFFSCKQATDKYHYIKLAGATQGTSYHITYKSSDSISRQPEIDSLLRRFDLSLSTYEPASVISRINYNDTGVILTDYFTTCFIASHKIYEETDGAFDITVAPVVNAWGFGFTEMTNPDSAMIDSLLQFVGMDKIKLVNGKILKSDPGVMLDVNAIAQGYAVDVVCDLFEVHGITDYLVEIGGEVRAKGVNDRGEYWRVGIDKPIEGLQLPGAQMQAVLSLKNRSLATSGNYRRFYIKDGIKYAHTIDPENGYPVEHNLLSATVLADDCMSADGYATAFMVMGLEKTKDFLKKRKDLDAYLIYFDETGGYKVFYTAGIKKAIIMDAG